MASFGPDGPAWAKLAQWQRAMHDRLTAALLAPLPALGPAWRLGPTHLLRLALVGLRSTAGLSERLFRTEGTEITRINPVGAPIAATSANPQGTRAAGRYSRFGTSYQI